MIKINILCIGKVKETFFRDAISEYSKRLSRYCNLNIIELQDKPIPDKLNLSIESQIKDYESEEILSHIPRDSYVIGLDLTGRAMSSESFADKISSLHLTTNSITFIIGGSLGINEKLKNYCNEKICFSQMTFPHQLIRLFLLEQIFRGFKIINNEKYHH